MFNNGKNIKLSHDDVFQHVDELRNAMCEEYQAWTKSQNLPDVDAEEMILHSIERVSTYVRLFVHSTLERDGGVGLDARIDYEFVIKKYCTNST